MDVQPVKRIIPLPFKGKVHCDQTHKQPACAREGHTEAKRFQRLRSQNTAFGEWVRAIYRRVTWDMLLHVGADNRQE